MWPHVDTSTMTLARPASLAESDLSGGGKHLAEPAGWRADPNGRHEMRYWDGAQWTDHVSDAGSVSRDPYDANVIPPPPPHVAATSPASASFSYRLVCYDRKGNEIYSAPYQSADMAMQFATDNPAFEMKHTLGSALWKGTLHKNIVEWRRAVIYRVNESTGESVEYHAMHKS